MDRAGALGPLTCSLFLMSLFKGLPTSQEKEEELVLLGRNTIWALQFHKFQVIQSHLNLTKYFQTKS